MTFILRISRQSDGEIHEVRGQHVALISTCMRLIESSPGACFSKVPKSHWGLVYFKFNISAGNEVAETGQEQSNWL